MATKLRRTGLSLCTVICAMQPILASGQTAAYRPGETIQLAPEMRLRVITGSLDVFRNVTLIGVGRVFELQFENPPGRFPVLEPSQEPGNSGVILQVGDSRVSPKALAYAKGSEHEVIMVDRLARNRENGRGAWFGFATQSNLQLLFDVPREIADRPMRLLAEILLDGKAPPLRIEVVK